MRKKLLSCVALSTTLCSLLIIADYYNFPSSLGIDVPSMNWDFLSLAIGNGLAIVLYLVTYLLIDQRQIKREENQLRNIRRILIDTYVQCQEQVEMLDDESILTSIAHKCNFDIPYFQDPIFTKIHNMPFELDQYILDASNNGVIREDEFEAYLDIRMEYKVYITNKITFFDIEKYPGDTQRKASLISLLETKRKKLMDMIDLQLSILKCD